MQGFRPLTPRFSNVGSTSLSNSSLLFQLGRLVFLRRCYLDRLDWTRFPTLPYLQYYEVDFSPFPTDGILHDSAFLTLAQVPLRYYLIFDSFNSSALSIFIGQILLHDFLALPAFFLTFLYSLLLRELPILRATL